MGIASEAVRLSGVDIGNNLVCLHCGYTNPLNRNMQGPSKYIILLINVYRPFR